MSLNDWNGEVDLWAQLEKIRKDLEIYQLRREVEQLQENFARMKAGRNISPVEPAWEERVVHNPLDAHYGNREVYQNHYWGGYSVDPYVPDIYCYPESTYWNPIDPPQSSHGYAEPYDSTENLVSEVGNDELRRMLEEMANSLHSNSNNIEEFETPQDDDLYEKLECVTRGMDRMDRQMQDMKECAKGVELHLNQIALAREERRTQAQFHDSTEGHPEEDCEERLEENEAIRVEEPQQHNDPQPVDVFEGEENPGDSSRPTAYYEDPFSAETEGEYVEIFPDEFIYRLGEPAVARYGGCGSCDVLKDNALEFLDDGRRLQFDGWPVQWEPWK